jgi:hypothetical protein
VTYDEKNREPEPTPRISIDEEPCFLRNIGVPLEKVLAEGDVTLESCEYKKEHSHYVVMFHGKQTLEVSSSD